ncbi:MAG: L,D-transpeptidase family protein [Chloroflexi bacterium]|nr:L,D-transpeptidase family protein [Chloroflexota bacterium]
MTSRRDFLKLSAASLAAALPSPFGGAVRLGRVTTSEAAVRQLPNPDSRLIRTAKQDDIVSILGELTGIGELSHNSIWFTLADGYIYSSWVQPVEQVFNLPLIAIPATGVWAEVSLPFTDARSEPREDAEIVYRLYYSAIFQVVARVDDAAGRAWYKIRDKGGRRFFSPAEALRPLSPNDLAPISPAVKNKRIVVGVNAQRLVAYENDRIVLQTKVSTGRSWFGADGTSQNFSTPFGDHRVYSKWIADHMKGADFDLPGVGWVTYFTDTGAGIHATYWHNDFGHPRSHGCVNVTPEAARWIFRWTTPEVPYYPGLVRGRGNSTRISVQQEM